MVIMSIRIGLDGIATSERFQTLGLLVLRMLHAVYTDEYIKIRNGLALITSALLWIEGSVLRIVLSLVVLYFFGN